ncbi:unnamed protein product [Rotaria sordida]|uniref:Uncharacterized protein n=1 Tax=Rotaria sordida TaxID=392033 RepID=A0A815WLJ7_9BILA|nr:unnamed protein product [Rotaria sordida]CAF1546891.1 unnamed protein product [Rotaria sordida]
MKRAPPESTVMSTSCSPAKHPKLDVSCNTTVNIDDITIAQDSVIIPRSYQTELVEQAKDENLIVCLPTGSGKTYIAVMLIKELAQETRKSIYDGGKRTVFLVKTVVLVQQQSDYIRIHTDLTVGTYYGDLGVDSWSKEKWINEFENHQVLVFTAQVFLNLIEHNYFPLYNVNLLIFDECQHSTGESCYPALMRRYNECHDPPRILGLTASISAKKITPYQLSNAVQQIEQTYKARVASGTNREESNRHGTSVQFEPIRCLTYQDQLENDQESIKIPFETIQSIVDDLKPYLSKQKAERENIEQDLVEFMLMTDYLDENFLEYIARQKSSVGSTAMTAKYKRQTIKEFRSGEINVLVATAVVEEGLDIPKCNLVFRFNRPPNFSSYMQSKGRARAKQNASYVILIDGLDGKSVSNDMITYQSYEQIEKMLQEEFSIDNDDDFNTDDLNQLEPYRRENGAVIRAVRAAQIIHQYCAIIGNGRLCPPRILYHKTSQSTFISVLSMPANCPVSEDIKCENKSKKLAKFQCCLKMVELLHRNKALDDSCRPFSKISLIEKDILIEHELFKLCDELFEKKNSDTIEQFERQINTFPRQSNDSSDTWHLYRINIRKEKDKLGFIVPSKLVDIPRFSLYDAGDEILTVDITYLYWTEQLRQLFASKLKIYSIMDMKYTGKLINFDDCLNNIDPALTTTLYTTRRPILPLTIFSYDSLTANNQSINEQPFADILFQAITRRSCGEKMDNENLEVLGDCFLKLAVSMALYYQYPSADAGLLTVKKNKQISNENLYRLAIQKELKSYLNANKIEVRGQNANWLPPGYMINDTESIIGQRYAYQTAKRKAFSDMIEAFIGAFLISTNYTTTIQFMHWLGLRVISVAESPSILRSNIGSTNENQICEIINKFFHNKAFNEIETMINYTFQNKAYLIAAFTHPSSFSNRLTDCYERLEFLGDAILDFLVTRYVFVNYNQKVTPGRVTDIRQDLSNNDRLAYILVACGLHRKILHNSTDLFGHISSYAGDEDVFLKDQSVDQYLSKDLDQWADSTAPKALADVFEALVGAIFLDSGNSLDVVWRVVEPLLGKYLDQSINHPNLNPIRSFTETGGKIVHESIDKSDDRPIAICVVRTANGVLVEGRGFNAKIAKMNACRQALKK